MHYRKNSFISYYIFKYVHTLVYTWRRQKGLKGEGERERETRTEIGGGAQFADCFFFCVRFSKVNLSLSSSSSLGGVELVLESESEFVFVLLEFVSS